MRGRVYRVEKHMERAVAATLPSNVANENFGLDGTAVSKRKAQMTIFTEKLSLVYLVDIHVSRMK
jgi:hypothetical protein